MGISTKLVAKEVLMCGLKNLPYIGTAVEVVEGVRRRHEQLVLEGRITGIETQMTRVDKTVRDAVEREIQIALANLSRPNLDGAALTNEIREIQGIRAQGWEPTLFDGLLANSSHWGELHRNPQNYGRVLSDNDSVNRDNIHLIIDADRTRLLELTPYAFSSLLSGQRVGTPTANIVSARDIWALPAAPGTSHGIPQPNRKSQTSSGKTQWKEFIVGSWKSSVDQAVRSLVLDEDGSALLVYRFIGGDTIKKRHGKWSSRGHVLTLAFDDSREVDLDIAKRDDDTIVAEVSDNGSCGCEFQIYDYNTNGGNGGYVRWPPQTLVRV